MKVGIVDIEADGLGQIVLDRKGNRVPPASKVHCAVVYDYNDELFYEFTPDNINELPIHLKQYDCLVAHNGIQYDFPVIRRVLGDFGNPIELDTLVVSRLMYPDQQNNPLGAHSLAAWGSHLGYPKMDYQGGFHEYNEEMLVYCKQDVLVNKHIYEAQKDFVKDWKKQVNFELQVTQILSQMTENGFGYDAMKGEQLEMNLLETKAEIEDEMKIIFPPITIERYSEKTGKRLKDKVTEFNPASRQQIAERFKTKYDWDAPVTDKGNPKVDSDILKALEYPEAKKLVDYFDCIKLISQVQDWNTRGYDSGLIHGSINPQGAATGRCTHSQPNVAQVSGNKSARSLWVPSKENSVLVGIDLSGLELRCLAHYMSKYDNGEYARILLQEDIHTYNQKKAGLPTRSMAKVFCYSILYGAGNSRIANLMNCSVYKAKKYREQFFDGLPALAKLQEDIKKQVELSGKIELPDGRTIPVRSAHASLNTLLQGAGAIISKAWLYIATANLKGWDYHLNAFVHDELVFTCAEDAAKGLGKIVVESAKEAGTRLKFKCPIDAEYHIGTNWGDVH